MKVARSFEPIEMVASAAANSRAPVGQDTHELTDHLLIDLVAHEVELLYVEVVIGNVIPHDERHFFG